MLAYKKCEHENVSISLFLTNDKLSKIVGA